MAHIRSETRKGRTLRGDPTGVGLTLVALIVNIVILLDSCETTESAPVSQNFTDFLEMGDRLFENDSNGTTEATNHTGRIPEIYGGTENETVVFEAGRILRCQAFGNPKPNISWELEGKPVMDLFLIKDPIYTFNDSYDQFPDHKSGNSNVVNKYSLNDVFEGSNNYSTGKDDIMMRGNDTITNQTSRIDLKLPKINLALKLYGNLVCKAENSEGVSTKSYFLVPNANSSFLMRLLRTSIAVFFLLVFIGVYKFGQMRRARRKLQRYEQLPSAEYKIIQQFRQGTQQGSSTSTTNTSLTNRFRLNQCLSSTTTGVEGGSYLDESNATMDSTVSTENNEEFKFNSWLNCVPYIDSKDILKDSFKIDFENVIENTDYGLLLEGSFRSQRTMMWKPVAVKTGKFDKDNTRILQGLLAELKTLASLTEESDFIVNLQAAFTDKLYKRKVYVFVDLCENGRLDKYIDLNRAEFRDIFAEGHGEPETVSRPKMKKFHLVTDKNDENQNPSTNLSNNKGSEFSTEELVVWSAEISDGMSFLHKNKITHGNLCTANVFLTDGLTAKIGNIGHEPYESQKDNRRYPPECKTRREFSIKTDIWSFGMTIWEIFTLRQQQQPTDEDLADFYSVGNQLNLPRHSNKDINELLYLCCNPEENLRPNFEQLSESIRQVLSTLAA